MSDIWQMQDAKNKLSEVIFTRFESGAAVDHPSRWKSVVVVAYAGIWATSQIPGKTFRVFQSLPVGRRRPDPRQELVTQRRETMKALFDTCIISELVSKQPDRQVVWVTSIRLDPEDIYLSVITIGESSKAIESFPSLAGKRIFRYGSRKTCWFALRETSLCWILRRLWNGAFSWQSWINRKNYACHRLAHRRNGAGKENGHCHAEC